ncbi:MAG TPA: DUF4097 family beta strand repeat-containing protein [Pyrinomonadaceae bacterium]|nr:DUF4097 family beta strand repeat-containing protein [Pyrinomonadaceae bacterium]
MTKKWFAAWAVIGLLVSLAASTAAHDNSNPQPGGKTERSLTVDPQAIVTLCVASGTLTVRGWDKNEIHVRSVDAAQLDFKRIDRVKDPSKPATRIDVMVWDKANLSHPDRDCQAVASVEMDMPAGATVQVQTRDGDITITGVAGVVAGSQNGDIMIDHVTRMVEAGSLGGSIYLKDSSGRVNLSSAGGGVEVTNVKPSDDEDTFEVGTVSGDIQLNRVSNQKVTAKTTNGTVTMTGPLAKSGLYNFQNMTGDLILAIPHDASFRLNAKVFSERQNFVSDFALKYLTDPPPPPPAKPRTPAPESVSSQYVFRRVSAVYGTGDATISIASFGGTVRLKKI